MGIKLALIFLLMNAAWEAMQLPFYTLWRDGTAGGIAYATAHCTVGDLLIGLWAAVTAAITARFAPVPRRGRTFIIGFTLIGLSYTIFSEWLNVHIRESWAYTELMPLLPPFGTGLTPVLQWIVVPLLTWAIAGQRARSWLAGCTAEDGETS